MNIIKSYIVTNAASSGGGADTPTLESVLTEDNDGGGFQIKNIADPTLAQDAATKAYADGLVLGLENSANKSTSVVTDQASNTKYPSVKSVYDWVIGLGYQVALTAANFGAFIVALTGKTTPVDADTIVISDSADSNNSKKVTWTNIKATLKTYFDTLYPTRSAVAPTDITASISAGAVSVNCGGDAITEKNIKTDSNLNINWSNLNEGGVLFIRLERTSTSAININFNGGSNTDCYVFGNTQILGSGSPLVLQGYTSGSGRNRIVYGLSITATHDITANKTVYEIRYDDSSSVVV